MASQQEQPNVVQHWLNKQSEHAFLEEVHGEAAIDWVKKKNDSCLAAIGEPTQSPMYDRVLAILDSKDKIPHVRKIGDRYFNFWQDGANKRGLWRCTSIESYMSESTKWETVLDVDELCEAEGESWVWKGHSLHHPLDPAAAPTRTLLKLSRGGSDAVVLREFDLETRRFVAPDAEERGFVVPEAKSTVSWLTRDALLIGTDMKDGASMTDSGYPRVVRVWRRGTPLADSTVIHEGEVKDVSVSGYSVRAPIPPYLYPFADACLTAYINFSKLCCSALTAGCTPAGSTAR
jgi:prolyl oligopeptidase